jgi:hypothetical protein
MEQHQLDLESEVIFPPCESYPSLGAACHLGARVPHGHFGVPIVDKFFLHQHRHPYPHLHQSSGRLFQSPPPPIDDIPRCHLKCPATLLARGRRISGSGRHLVCMIPTAKNKSSGSCVVTSHASRLLQPLQSALGRGGAGLVVV